MALNLVTGGCGFIGSHLVRLLRERGESVRVLDMKTPVELLDGVEYRHGSITSTVDVEEAVSGCIRVFHLAALSGLWNKDKNAFVTVNREGTRKVLEAARRFDIETLVHTSTESVLIAMHRGRHPQTVNEKTGCTLREMAGAYCRGKYLAEMEALNAVARGQRVIVVNPTVPTGPGDHWITPPTRMMLGFLNNAYPAYLDSTLNLTDVRDIALGHLLAAEAGEPGRRYILGAYDVSMSRLLELLAELSGRDMVKRRIPYPVALGVAAVSELVSDFITHRPPVAPLSGVRLAGVPVTFDNSDTRKSLGWKPRLLEDTLRDAIEDYRIRRLI